LEAAKAPQRGYEIDAIEVYSERNVGHPVKARCQSSILQMIWNVAAIDAFRIKPLDLYPFRGAQNEVARPCRSRREAEIQYDRVLIGAFQIKI
jgi:hypothetical protein